MIVISSYRNFWGKEGREKQKEDRAKEERNPPLCLPLPLRHMYSPAAPPTPQKKNEGTLRKS